MVETFLIGRIPMSEELAINLTVLLVNCRLLTNEPTMCVLYTHYPHHTIFVCCLLGRERELSHTFLVLHH